MSLPSFSIKKRKKKKEGVQIIIYPVIIRQNQSQPVHCQNGDLGHVTIIFLIYNDYFNVCSNFVWEGYFSHFAFLTFDLDKGCTLKTFKS